MPVSKYKNQKTVVYGIAFDSKHEAQQYLILRDRAQRGEITDLTLQVPFEIIPAVTVRGRRLRAIKYVADFVYTDKDGHRVVVDAKGCRTREYGIKKRLMKLVQGIEIVEV
jgi:hypothetical protein